MWRRFVVNADGTVRRKAGVLGPPGTNERRSTKILCPACGAASCGVVRAGHEIGLSITPEPIEKRGATARKTVWTFTCAKSSCTRTFSERAPLVLDRIARALEAGERQVIVKL